MTGADRQPRLNGPPRLTDVWPDLSALDLGPTMTTMHLWSQVVGKIRLMLTPWENHGWHVPLYVSSRGLSTNLIQTPGVGFSIEFDLIDGVLRLSSSDGRVQEVILASRSVASFYAEVITALSDLGIVVQIASTPVELPDAVPFDVDHELRTFDLEVAREYWGALLEVRRVFQLFRTRFIGKCSPIHLFWGAFDLAVTRFSGRSAPRHPGGAPHMPDAVAREAYSREVSSAGFWPNLGGTGGPSFYAYAYPVPDGFASAVVEPAAARFDKASGEFLLSYAAVRAAPDPDAALLDFLQSTYEAAADNGSWDRPSLERPEGSLGRPPPGS